jgi:glycerol kinase
MPVNAGRLRQLNPFHRAYGTLYNESSIVRTTVGRVVPVECMFADVSTALFAVLCSSLTSLFM